MVFPETVVSDPEFEWTHLFNGERVGLATLVIFGERHHLEAIPVDADGIARAEVEKVVWAEAICGDGPLQPVLIEGKHYVLVMTPVAS